MPGIATAGHCDIFKERINMTTQKNRLIIIDGMPGSGKTTCAVSVAEALSARQVPNRCILELEENHPLFIRGYEFSSLADEQQADLFITQLQAVFRDFVQERLNSAEEFTIIESVLFQDALSCACHMGMDNDKLLDLSTALKRILSPLDPVLIYFYQLDVEAQWRFICSVRGNEWGPVSLHTDEDFQEAAALWGGSQAFNRTVVESWDIPKLIIENKEYLWAEYTERVIGFIEEQL
jgi:energy-coupling factor transporter ATP-binding protein EcfA2